jgi:hypothetical protein
MRLFLTSTLSLICPEHPALEANRALWLEIARRSFRSGKYNAQDEIDAHKELTGATVKDSYVVLNNRYQLIPAQLTARIVAAIGRDGVAGVDFKKIRWHWLSGGTIEPIPTGETRAVRSLVGIPRKC